MLILKKTLFDILKILNVPSLTKKNFKINNLTNIFEAKQFDLTVCSKFKYIENLKNTKASACLIKKNFKKYVPQECYSIISDDPEIDFIRLANIYYKNFIYDDISKKTVNKNLLKKKFKLILFGNNFICENNVKIGKNVQIGHNVIIKNNSVIGDNVRIGSNVVISNSIIANNVNICDGSVVGKKGFGFKLYNGKVIRVPHLGKVIIKEGSEIGSNCNIDRGSFSDTVIGKYTFLDNQIQIAHNVKIGDYCVIASQVGISGSTEIGNFVTIGGQAGISGHLKIGSNVKIGGKTGAPGK